MSADETGFGSKALGWLGKLLALLAAFAQGTGTVRKDHVRLAARDSAFGVPTRWRAGYAFAALLTLGLIGGPLAYLVTHPSQPLASLVQSALAQLQAPAVAQTGAMPEQAVSGGSSQARRVTLIDDRPAAPQSAPTDRWRSRRRSTFSGPCWKTRRS